MDASAAATAGAPVAPADELFDIYDEHGSPLGLTHTRTHVHAVGLYHKAVHTWLFSPHTNGGELLLQKRADCKDSWPGRWDISSAGHISAGQRQLETAARELEEELGICLPLERFEHLFTHLEKLHSVQHGRDFINNEFNEVFLITVTPDERERFAPGSPGIRLQESEVSDIRWVPWTEVRDMYRRGDPTVVPCSDFTSYGRLFEEIQRRMATVAK